MASDGYVVTYHSQVTNDEDEYGLLTKAQHRRIQRKLAQDPLRFKPLRGDLVGLRRIREGDVRVIYAVTTDVVVILAIDMRRDNEAYDLVKKRLPGS